MIHNHGGYGGHGGHQRYGGVRQQAPATPAGAPTSHEEKRRVYLMLIIGILAGYVLGTVFMETADVMFTTKLEHHSHSSTSQQSSSSNGIGRSLAAGQAAAAISNAVSQIRKDITAKKQGNTIHSLLTSNGSPYQNFQGRIMYATYKLVQKMPGGEHLTGFTRILHRSVDDNLMNEIPSYRVNPLHPQCDVWCEFPVADRPNAVRQWVEAADKDPSMIQGAWVLLLESDYVWMKPLQAPDAYAGGPGRQFHYDYIMPEYPGVPQILERLVKVAGMSIKEKVPASGPAPALLRFSELKQTCPVWEKVTAAIEADKEAVKVLGWIREMYAWDLAIAANNIKMDTEDKGVSTLFTQPPHDDRIGSASICHYTWGAIYHNVVGGAEVWRWEKRDYTAADLALKVPKLPMPPQPFQPNAWLLQDGKPVTKELHDTLTAMLGQMNKAIETLPDLRATGRMQTSLS